jgi:tetratricopeptide (TPR) repeat protein
MNKILFILIFACIIFSALANKNSTKIIGQNKKITKEYNDSGVRKLEDYRLKEAIKDFDKAIELDPKNSKAYYHRGFAKISLSMKEKVESDTTAVDYTEAIKDYTKAIELDPKHFSAYEMRGMARYFMGQYREAIKDYDKAIKLNPKRVVTYLLRGSAKLELSLYKEARADYLIGAKIAKKDNHTELLKSIEKDLQELDKAEKTKNK